MEIIKRNLCAILITSGIRGKLTVQRRKTLMLFKEYWAISETSNTYDPTEEKEGYDES